MTPHRQLTRRTAHKQHGFTLIELMVAIAVASLLGFLAVQALGGQQDTARVGSARSFFTEDLPSALTSFGSAVGQNTDVTDPDDIIPYGVPADTAWGEAWEVSTNGPARTGVEITYPIGGSNPDDIGANLESLLTSTKSGGDPQFPYITDVSYNNSSLTAKVRQF
ncbi:type II secretion system protein [Endozoicomonas sp. G2_2]|uniref:type II secretion system protein n=1 Tax=Endozoicomonas sp. G2_2 TaxID=2821092 RepID=UPI001ADBC584|nr:type II secretion system protein [Endozoicomonas sp. G2_2]MBO9471088.1 type II secretion system protein [Endozoicomonas sp. G2_2]